MLACTFDSEFLAVPPECLILTMKANQKYFPLLDAEGAGEVQTPLLVPRGVEIDLGDAVLLYSTVLGPMWKKVEEGRR